MIGRTHLDSGLRVVTEQLPHLRSVAVGFWVGTGSRDEPADQAGVSHFLEHLLFKGSGERDAAAIAEAVESGGGDMNAFTAQEVTTFYVRVPDDRLPLALDILSDIVWRPALRAADVDSERQVILEELHLRDDEPEDLVHDLFTRAVFPQHPIGREVIGSEATIEAMTRDGIADFHARHYRPGNVVVSVAGNLDHDQVVNLVEKGLDAANGARPPRDAWSGEPPPEPLAVLERPTEQAHVVLGMRAFRNDDPDRYALTVLNQALGGGMSSRLFQEVREQRGLCYAIYAFHAPYSDIGMFGLYAGTDAADVAELMRVVVGEINAAAETINEAEVARAKAQMKAGLLMALESSSARAEQLARQLFNGGRPVPLDELVEKIEAVTVESARAAGRALIARGRPAVAALGPGAGLETAATIADSLARRAA